MTFDFTDDQYAIADVMRKVFSDANVGQATRRWYQGNPPANDEQRQLALLLAEQGLLGTFVPEGHGGSGLGLLDVVMVFEAAGAQLLSYPLMETLSAAWALSQWCGENQRHEWLPGLAAGTLIPAVAWTGFAGGAIARRQGRDWAVDIPGVLVGFPDLADIYLVPVALEGPLGWGLAVLEPREVAREAAIPWDLAYPTAMVTAARLTVPEERVVQVPEGQLGDLLALGRILGAAEVVGAMEEVLTRSVQYLNTRRQFGGPIGRFQALKHTAALDHTRTVNARLAVRYAAWSWAEREPRRGFYAALAKSYASEHGVTVAEDGVHLHGGMGFTWDADFHLFLKRVWRLASVLGTAEECRREMAAAFLDRGEGTDA
jgi:alkylation response protein AidB-like acyl-CoA dehydrogenase